VISRVDRYFSGSCSSSPASSSSTSCEIMDFGLAKAIGVEAGVTESLDRGWRARGHIRLHRAPDLHRRAC
jgi:hypothetical protein